MAPISANTAGFAQKQARRPVARIVPAIPHRLSRAPPSARPITPEESNKGTVTQQEPEPQTVVEKQVDGQGEEPQIAAAETPLTPDSRVSAADKNEADAPALAHSPPTSQDDHVESAVDGQDTKVNGHLEDTPTTLSATPAEPKPVVNGVPRKLTIPAQLPPPFYPSSKADTQTPPADVSDATQAPAHQHQLSAGAVVFQSANASPANPATPHESESDVHGQQQALPRPPPGLAPPQYAPFFPAHSHHLSDVATTPWHQPPYSAHDPLYEHGGDYRSPQFPTGPNTYPTLCNGQVPPRGASFAMAGTTTSHPQSPIKAQFGETKSSSVHGEEQHTIPYQNGTAPPTERLEESPFELAAYLSTQFGNPEFADFILQVRSSESALVSIPVHGIVVVRSPVIAEAIRHSPAPSHRSRDARRLIDVLALDPFTTRESLEEALKVLYGAPLLSAQNFLYGLGPYMYESDQASPSPEARRRMQQVLSYIAAARTLQLPSMQARGVEIARALLRWDTVDQVLRYGLQASSGTRSRTEGPDTEDPFLAALLNYAIDFIAYTFPVDFKLYTIAPEFQDVPRLPKTVVESRPPTHNPRLSKIRFGDAPPEDDLQPSHATSILSTVLLSLPLPLMERLFNHRATANQVGWTGAARIMRDVITERENRRRKALRGQLKPSQDGTVSAALLNNMYVEEQLEPSPLHPSGHKLVTKRSSGET